MRLCSAHSIRIIASLTAPYYIVRRRHSSPSTAALVCELHVACKRSHAVRLCARYTYAATQTLDGLGSLRNARSRALDRALATMGDAAAERAPSARLQSGFGLPVAFFWRICLSWWLEATPGAMVRVWEVLLPLRTRSSNPFFSPSLPVCELCSRPWTVHASASSWAGSSGSSGVGARDGTWVRHWGGQGARGAVWRPRLCRARAPCVCVCGRGVGPGRECAEAAVHEIVGSHKGLP